MTSNTRQRIRQATLWASGWVSLGLGIVGIVLPLLPTTPFLLLSAWCFAGSSKKAHHWLLHHRVLGPTIRAWQNGEGIPARVRNRAIAAIWLGMLLSMFIVGRWWVTITLALIGAGVSLYLFRLPVQKKPN